MREGGAEGAEGKERGVEGTGEMERAECVTTGESAFWASKVSGLT